MHYLTIIQKTFQKIIHAKRLATLKLMVHATFMSQSLTVTQLGRALSYKQSERNGIRKADRFLSNKKLHDEYPLICKKLCSNLIQDTSHPFIIVDWTKVPHKKFHVIRASLAAPGRAITLYEEVHEEKYLGSQKVHKKFIQSLKEILPFNCKPIIITDAGFEISWFKLVLKQNWNYIGRVRGHKYYSINDIWHKCYDLHNSITSAPSFIGEIKLTKKHSFETNMYAIKNTPKGRHAFNKAGNISKDSKSKSKSKAAKEPLVIVTSLLHKTSTPKKAIKIYQTRMTIEEGFRDLKSTKYGFGFEHMMSYKPKRILMLLLIAMIASFIAYITGMIAEKHNIHYLFQANTIKHRRVLSFFYLGRRIIKKRFLQKSNLLIEQNFYKLSSNMLLENI